MTDDDKVGRIEFGPFGEIKSMPIGDPTWRIDIASADAKRLRELLGMHGGHLQSCAGLDDPLGDRMKSCTCGWDEVVRRGGL